MRLPTPTVLRLGSWILPAHFLALSLLSPALGAAAATAAVAGEAREAETVTTGLLSARAIDTAGVVHRLGMRRDLGPVALVILDTECVISRRAITTLNDLARSAERVGAEFYGVLSSPYITLQEARDFVSEYEVGFPLLFDSNGDLTAKLEPKWTPEAFVVGGDDRLLYRGRIDDSFSEVGRRRAVATQNDLADAIADVASGALIELRETRGVGCVYEAWEDETPEPTYHRNVAQVIAKNCSGCHTEGSVAPFALDDYRSVRRRAKMILATTSEGFMPPWQTKRGHGVFRSSNRLSPLEIDTIRRWIAAGAPEGQATDHLAVTSYAGQDGAMPEPDLVAQMPEPFTVAAGGDDIYRYFVLPRSELLDADQVVTGIGFRPGAPSVVHHADFFVDYSGRARAADEADPEPGFSVFGTGGFLSYFDSGFLGAWAPGGGDSGGAWQLPADTGIPVPAGGDLVIEIHYHPSGREEIDQSQLELYFADEVPSRSVAMIFPGTTDVAIPAGDDDYQRRFWTKVPTDTYLYSIAPHMHFIGTEVAVDAHLPDGGVTPLLHLDRWDFRWQGAYEFPKPILLPAGTRIDATFTFDNSADNPNNPVSPPTEMDWGWATTQEMAELYLLSSTVDPEAMPLLQTAAYATWYRSADPEAAEPLPGLVSPRATRHRLGDLSLWTAEGQRMLYQVTGEPWFDDLIGLYEARAQTAEGAERAQLLADLGTLVMMQSAVSIDKQRSFRLANVSYGHFQKALETDPDNWDALYGLATSNRMAPPSMGLRAEALQQLRRLEELAADPEMEVPSELREKALRDLERMERRAGED